MPLSTRQKKHLRGLTHALQPVHRCQMTGFGEQDDGLVEPPARNPQKPVVELPK